MNYNPNEIKPITSSKDAQEQLRMFNMTLKDWIEHEEGRIEILKAFPGLKKSMQVSSKPKIKKYQQDIEQFKIRNSMWLI